MFCSACGVQASGKFCWSCGSVLKCADIARVPTAEDDNPRRTEPPRDWCECLDCTTLVAIPEVRARIARHAAKAADKLSGEDFLNVCDKIVSPLTSGVPLTIIAKIALPISEKLGLKIGKSRRQRIADGPGRVLVAILCSLAENGQRITEVAQTSTSCMLQVTLPSDLWSLKGNLQITIEAAGADTIVAAALTIPGQVYDWGKSNRVLDRLFADATQLARAA